MKEVIFTGILAAVAVGVGAVRMFRRNMVADKVRKREQIKDAWLAKLLPVLEGQAPAKSLTPPMYQEEMQAVMVLLEELAGRFRGQYRDRLRAVIRHIGADNHALHLLAVPEKELKIRGCALLAWSGPDTNVDLQLTRALGDEAWEVRLEAGCALAVRQPLGLSLEDILVALRGSPAMDSDRIIELVQSMASAPGRGDELARLLMTAFSPRERVVLLKGLAVADDLVQADIVAWQLADYDAEVRAQAVRTLERFADPMQIQKVLALRDDADAQVRLAVVSFATAMGGIAPTMDALLKLSKDVDKQVADAAQAGVKRWGDDTQATFVTGEVARVGVSEASKAAIAAQNLGQAGAVSNAGK